MRGAAFRGPVRRLFGVCARYTRTEFMAAGPKGQWPEGGANDRQSDQWWLRPSGGQVQPLRSGLPRPAARPEATARHTGVEARGSALLRTLQHQAALQRTAAGAHPRTDLCQAGSGAWSLGRPEAVISWHSPPRTTLVPEGGEKAPPNQKVACNLVVDHARRVQQRSTVRR
jgi:hypothetical protein